MSINQTFLIEDYPAASCGECARHCGSGRIEQMASLDEQILRATKEIVVKFIEGGRISPAGFPETFKSIYRAVEDTVSGKPQGK